MGRPKEKKKKEEEEKKKQKKKKKKQKRKKKKQKKKKKKKQKKKEEEEGEGQKEPYDCLTPDHPPPAAIMLVISNIQAIKAVKVAKKECSVEMPDTEISRWQAFDAGKHLTLRSTPRPLAK